MPEPVDQRLRKGERRRLALIDATLRVIGRGGAAAVTQRAVAAEAGVPPSAVLYYFASVDDLLVAALSAVNDRYVTRLEAIGTVDALVALVEDCARPDRMSAVAEYELFLHAARRADLATELHRWDDALADVAVRLLPDDPGRRPLLVAAVNGLCLAATLGSPYDTGVLERLVAG
ncbi:TetR family transcriptional regulator [Pseudonocardia sp. C8]|uniref:TetR/AcrR family transcriptional regulator n=1 Tax=Pseudonocardia sp. C8 TaxID=2762759 RepID=UPI0016430775|nr:TetR family transcriptional regulator [Pseudonocardia sp. C8]MBC3189817.1 TetR family transcriptional regulator [Pseudonocardia sp. C8]